MSPLFVSFLISYYSPHPIYQLLVLKKIYTKHNFKVMYSLLMGEIITFMEVNNNLDEERRLMDKEL